MRSNSQKTRVQAAAAFIIKRGVKNESGLKKGGCRLPKGDMNMLFSVSASFFAGTYDAPHLLAPITIHRMCDTQISRSDSVKKRLQRKRLYMMRVLCECARALCYYFYMLYASVLMSFIATYQTLKHKGYNDALPILVLDVY